MDLDTVIDNLKHTINNKKVYHSALVEQLNNPYIHAATKMALSATVEFLCINISELERILADVQTVKSAA